MVVNAPGCGQPHWEQSPYSQLPVLNKAQRCTFSYSPRSQDLKQKSLSATTTAEVVDILSLARALKSTAKLLISTSIFLKVLFFTGKKKSHLNEAPLPGTSKY